MTHAGARDVNPSLGFLPMSICHPVALSPRQLNGRGGGMKPHWQQSARPAVEVLEGRELPSATPPVVPLAAPVLSDPGAAQAAILLGLDQLHGNPSTSTLDGRGQAV